MEPFNAACNSDGRTPSKRRKEKNSGKEKKKVAKKTKLVLLLLKVCQKYFIAVGKNTDGMVERNKAAHKSKNRGGKNNQTSPKKASLSATLLQSKIMTSMFLSNMVEEPKTKQKNVSEDSRSSKPAPFIVIKEDFSSQVKKKK